MPVLVSAGALISLTTLLHLDRFTPGPRLVYWLVIYVGAPLPALLLYAQHERAGANWNIAWPVTRATRAISVTLGTVLVVGGLLILVRPEPVVASWPWPTTPLMVRIFASWFGAFGAGLLWFLVERDWERVRHIPDLMIAASGLDLFMVLIHHRDLTSSGPRLWLYLSHLALFGLLGLLLRGLQRRAASGDNPTVLPPDTAGSRAERTLHG